MSETMMAFAVTEKGKPMTGGDNMRNDKTYITEPYMSASPKGQLGE